MASWATLPIEFAPSHRLSLENFYSHSGRDEGRFFEGYNVDNARFYRNFRTQFIEEGLLSNAVAGEHFFQNSPTAGSTGASTLRARPATNRI